jgi:hypothetical protein
MALDATIEWPRLQARNTSSPLTMFTGDILKKALKALKLAEANGLKLSGALGLRFKNFVFREKDPIEVEPRFRVNSSEVDGVRPIRVRPRDPLK